MEKEIEQIIIDTMEALNRPDLFRKLLVAFSSATDERYEKLKTIIGPWHQTPTEIMPDSLSVITYFVPLTKEVVEEPQNVTYSAPLWGEAYDVLNAYFNHVNDCISLYLAEQGFDSTKLGATYSYDPETCKAKWAHRSAAVIAGLGCFGINRSVITSKGSAGRFGSVLTSAPLKAESEQVQESCLHLIDGSCGLCIKACPANCLGFDTFDSFACGNLMKKHKEIQKDVLKYGAGTCGKCVSVCPVGYRE